MIGSGRGHESRAPREVGPVPLADPTSNNRELDAEGLVVDEVTSPARWGTRNLVHYRLRLVHYRPLTPREMRFQDFPARESRFNGCSVDTGCDEK